MRAIGIWLVTLIMVWSVQQAWRFSGRYIEAIKTGVVPDYRLLWQAWATRRQAPPCPAGLWWLLSLLAVLGLGGWWGVFSTSGPACFSTDTSNYFFSCAPRYFSTSWVTCFGLEHCESWAVLAALAGQPPLELEYVWFRYGLYLFGTLCMPALLVALWRIDAHVFLLPDGLLVLWAGMGAMLAMASGRWPVSLTLAQLLLFLFFMQALAYALEKQKLTGVTQWIGAGDLKFLWAAFFWLSAGQIMLMWFYTALGCWCHQAWRQRRFLPRGHCALGPYLVLAWVVTVLGHSA